MSQSATSTLTKSEVKLPSMWTVTLHNDNFTPMDFVTQVLIQVFHKSFEESTAIMLTVHEKGKAVVNLYTEEVAKTKAEQVIRIAEANGHPLLATAEPA